MTKTDLSLANLQRAQEGEPDAAVVFLSSPLSSHFTGHAATERLNVKAPPICEVIVINRRDKRSASDDNDKCLMHGQGKERSLR